MIIAVGLPGAINHLETFTILIPTTDYSQWSIIFSGALLAFYAFIGFEDMVDVAEEVKNVKRNLPLAIMLTLAITTVLYLLIMTTAVLAIPPYQLAQAEAPLAFLYEHFTGNNSTLITIIGLFSIINGALIQIIMASRVIYGMSSRGQLPELLSFIHPKSQTPLIATFICTSLILILALVGHLSILAKTTSLIMLCIFALINLALLKIKQQKPVTHNSISFPKWVPFLGFIINLGVLFFIFLDFFSE